MADPVVARALAKAVIEGGGEAALRRLADNGGTPGSGLVLRVALAPALSDLTRESEVVKTALLYADTVELVSPTAAMLFVTKNLRHMTEDERLTMMGPVAAILGNDQVAAVVPQLRQLLNARHLSGAALQQQRNLRRGFREQWESVSAMGEQMWRDAGGEQLDIAWEAGLLRFALIDDAVRDLDALVDHFVEDLRGAIEGTQQYPLLDDSTGSLVASAVAEGTWTIPELTTRRVAEASLATGLVGQLPAYPNASMEGVLEARAELHDHLPPFRRAVAHLDAAANDPFAQGFNDGIRDVYLKEVEPAFSDLRDELRRVEGRLLGTALTTAPAPAVTSLLSFGHLDPVLAGGITATSWVGAAGATLLSQRGGRRRAAQRNPFYLLYGANEHWQSD